MAGGSWVKGVAGLAGWLGACALAAALGGLASVRAEGFYQQLQRPPWAPPGWLFGPVWTLLYLLMALAAWLVWRQEGFRRAAWLFLAQLGLNALWTWLFFRWRLGALAFAEILALWALLALTLAAFWRRRPLAGALLVPYLAWVTFAAALAWSVWRLNPALLG